MSSMSLCTHLDTKHLQLLLAAQGLSTTGTRKILEERLEHEIRRRACGTWILEKLPPLPVSRIGCSIVEYEYAFYLFGGFDTMGIPSNSLYVYKAEQKSWQRVQISGTTPAPALNDHVAVVYEHELWIFGSLRGPRVGHREVCIAVYNFQTSTWRTIERRGFIPQSIEDFKVFDHCLREDVLLLATKEGIFGYHFQQEVWMNIHRSLPLDNFWGNYHMTTEDSDLLIFGWSAATDNISQEQNSLPLELRMYRLNIDTGNWSRLLFSGSPPTYRGRCKALKVDDKWLLHGGSTEYGTGESLSETFVFNLTSRTWIQLELEEQRLVPRAHYGATVCRDEAIIFTGGRINWLGNNKALSTPCDEVEVLRLLRAADLDQRKEPNAMLVFVEDRKCTMISSYRQELYNNPHLSDVKLRVQNRVFYSHRLILAEASTVFAKMWSLEMSESTDAEIDLKSMDVETAEMVLSYVYGCLDRDTLTRNTINVFRAADLYEIQGLKMECLKYMISDISANSVLDYWTFGDFYSCEELMKACVYFAASKSLFNSLAFIDLAHRRPIACYRFLRSILRELSQDPIYNPRSQSGWCTQLSAESEALDLLDISTTAICRIDELLAEITRLRNRSCDFETV